MNSVRQRGLCRGNLRRIDGVQHVELWKTVDGAERLAHHRRTKARAAHAQEHRVQHTGVGNLLSGPGQWPNVRQLVIGDVQPPQPALLVGTSPEVGVSRPQTADLSRLLPVRDNFRHARREVCR